MKDESHRPRRGWLVLGAIVVVVAAVSATYLVTRDRDDKNEQRRDDDVAHGTYHNHDDPVGVDCDTAPSYRFQKLHAPMNVKAVSPNGGYIVGILSKGGFALDKSFGLWHDGTFKKITGAPSRKLEALDVNDSGEVVGTGDDAWRYAHGRFQTLRPLRKSDDVEAIGIANDGTVAGQSVEPGDQHFHATAVRWKPGDAKPRPLEVPGHKDGEVTDVAADGTIVGAITDSDEERPISWVWDADGHGRDLLNDDSLYSYPEAIAGDWVAVDTAARGTGSDPAGGYDMTGLERVNLADGKRDKVRGVNAYVVESDGGAYIDECGRVYGETDKQMLAFFDTSVHVLSEVSAPDASEADYEEDASTNVFRGVSDDGSVAVARTWKEIAEASTHPVMWKAKR